MSNLILRLAKRSLRKEKGDVELDSVGGVGDMGCGMWDVGCGVWHNPHERKAFWK